MHLSIKVFLVTFICLMSSIKLIDASCNENQTSSERSTWGNVKCSFRAGGRHIKDGWNTAVDGVKTGVNKIKEKIHGSSTIAPEHSFDTRFGESQIGEQAAQVSNDPIMFPTESYNEQPDRPWHYRRTTTTVAPPILDGNTTSGEEVDLESRGIFVVQNSCNSGYRVDTKGICRRVS